MTSGRGPGGRFVKRSAPQGDAGTGAPPPVRPDDPPGERPPLIALRVEPIDPGPRDPAEPFPEVAPAPGALADGPPPDDADARSLVAVALDGLDALVRLALGSEYGADPERLDELKAAAVPVAIRAGRLVGAGDAATRTLPDWGLELVRLGARAWVAYADAIAEAWRAAVAARRAERDEVDDAPDGSTGRGDDGRGGRPGGAAAGGGGGGPAPRDPVRAGAAPAGPDRPRGAGDDYGDRLAAALARSGRR